MIELGVVEVAKRIKQIHTEDVVLIKYGSFYHCYGKDAYIMSYLYDYQIKKAGVNVACVGFPENSLIKIQRILEDEFVNYVVIDKSSNYEVIEIQDKNKDNKYSNLYSKAHTYVSTKNKIGEINQYLLSNIGEEFIKNKLQRIEDIIYE